MVRIPFCQPFLRKSRVPREVRSDEWVSACTDNFVTMRGEVVVKTKERTGRERSGESDQLIRVRAQTMSEPAPRITAFIWGGKVRPQPTLPFGRWKDVA